MSPQIRPYDDARDRAQVIALWQEVFGYTADHNAPALVIDQKVGAEDGLLFVCRAAEGVVGTVMAGYDGHRGWLYSLSVHPAHRNQGLGTRLVRHAEDALAQRGCLKVNLQMLESNGATAAFYQRLGYVVEPRISMGKRLSIPPTADRRTVRGTSSASQVPTMPKNTVRLHRVLRATPDRIYRAFLDPDAMAKWLPPYGFTCKVHHMDAKVGGTFRMSFSNFSTGHGHAFGGEYLELVPHERIRYTDKFDDPGLPGEMVTTVSLRQVSCGTELNVEQEGIPEAIPVEMCYLGWQDSLAQLAKLVEPAIPD